jgi:hypothetical protein
MWGVTALPIPARRATLRTIRPGAVQVQPPPVRALADGQVDRPGGPRRQRDGDHLAALAGDRQRPVPALQAEVVDVGAGGLGNPQPVQREQGDQRILGRRAEPGGDQQRAELVAVQRDRVGLVVHPGRRTCAAGEWSRSSSSTAYL